MYDDDFKDEDLEKSTSGNTLKDFYEANKKLVWLLCGVIVFILLLVIITKLTGSSSNNSNNKNIKIEIIGCETETKYLTINTDLQLYGSINDGSLIWSSSNQSVASVDSKTGLVHGVGFGQSEITLASMTSNVPSAKCTIVVGKGDSNLKVSNITVPDGEIVMMKNATYPYPINIVPTNAFIENVEYKSTNINIASVDNDGIIHANNLGTTTINFTTSANGMTYTGNMRVNVIDEYIEPTVVQKPEMISLTNNLIKITVGEEANIDYNIFPATVSKAQLVWKSQNENVATVTNGIIKAINKGETIVTVRGMIGDASQSITVQVVDKEIAVDNIIIMSEQNTSLYVGGTHQITAMVSPSDATDKTLSYISSNPSIAAVSNTGLVTALASGTSVITVKSANEKQNTVYINVMESTTPNNNTTGGGSSNSSGSGSSSVSRKVKIETTTKNANSTYEAALRNAEKGPSTVKLIKDSSVSYVKYCTKNSSTGNPGTCDAKSSGTKYSSTFTVNKNGTTYIGYAAYNSNNKLLDTNGWYMTLNGITSSSSSTSANSNAKVTSLTFTNSGVTFQPSVGITARKDNLTAIYVKYNPTNATNKSITVTSGDCFTVTSKTNSYIAIKGTKQGICYLTVYVNDSSLQYRLKINVT